MFVVSPHARARARMNRMELAGDRGGTASVKGKRRSGGTCTNGEERGRNGVSLLDRTDLARQRRRPGVHLGRLMRSLGGGLFSRTGSETHDGSGSVDRARRQRSGMDGDGWEMWERGGVWGGGCCFQWEMLRAFGDGRKPRSTSRGVGCVLRGDPGRMPWSLSGCSLFSSAAVLRLRVSVGVTKTRGNSHPPRDLSLSLSPSV